MAKIVFDKGDLFYLEDRAGYGICLDEKEALVAKNGDDGSVFAVVGSIPDNAIPIRRPDFHMEKDIRVALDAAKAMIAAGYHRDK